MQGRRRGCLDKAEESSSCLHMCLSVRLVRCQIHFDGYARKGRRVTVPTIEGERGGGGHIAEPKCTQTKAGESQLFSNSARTRFTKKSEAITNCRYIYILIYIKRNDAIIKVDVAHM